MSIAGKNSIYYKKKDLQTQKTPAIGFKKFKAMHEASAGDTIIELTSLTLPSVTPGFVNPSASDVAAAQLVFNEKNLTVVSSLSGVLDWDSYSIPSNTTIKLKEAAEDKELFSIIVDPVAKTGLKTVDADPVVVTGELAAGATEFVVGTPFDVNKYGTQQQGSILVFLDGQLMSRNVGNAVNSPSADGDYHEVDNGGGIGTIIRFNQSSGSKRAVSVNSNGLAFSAPDDSAKAVIESLAGQVDSMIPTLAALAGVAESEFQAAPNYQDLKAFGERVQGLADDIDVLDSQAQKLKSNGEILGVTDGSSAASGEVGEYIEVLGNFTPTTGGWSVSSPLALPPGDWDLSWTMASLNAPAAGSTGIQYNLSLGTSTAGAEPIDSYSYVQAACNGQKGGSSHLSNYRVSITTADNYYAKAIAAGASFTNPVYYKLSARRIR